MVPRKIRVELCIEPETDFLGFGSFWDGAGFYHVLRATKIYSHNFCYQERTVNIDVYVSVDTGSFSVAILLSYYHMLQHDLLLLYIYNMYIRAYMHYYIYI